MRAEPLASAALSLALLAPAAARAADPPPRLALRVEYHRGPGTLCRDDAARVLAGDLQYDQRPDADLRLAVEAARHGGQHRVSAVLHDASGAVTWEGAHEALTCSDALESAMLSVALELRTRRALASASSPTPPAPAPAPFEPLWPPPPLPVAPAAPTPLSPALPFDVLVGADVVAAAGGTPLPSVGPGVFVAIRLHRVPLSFEVAGRASWTLVAINLGGVHFRSSLYAGLVAACGHWRFAAFCPVIGLGELDHEALAAGIVLNTPRPFGVLGARVVAGRSIGDRYLVRGFLELDGLPGSAELSFHTAVWRASVGGVAGLGVALEP